MYPQSVCGVKAMWAAARDRLHEDDMPLDFLNPAYERLKRHKYPFAGALKQVGAGLSRPRREDPFYQRMKSSKRDTLTRHFAVIRTKLGERLHQLVAAKHEAGSGGTGGARSAGPSTINCFRASVVTAEATSSGDERVEERDER